MNFNHYFKRQIELWGEERQLSLQDKSIAIIGAGGLGSSLAYALGSSGIGRVDIVDFDRVSLHNIHRQIAFTLNDENEYKAQVVSNVIKSKSPFLKSQAFIMDFEEFSNIDNNRYNLILDATDNLPSREMINHYSKAHNIPWIYASVEEFNGQICFFDKSSFGVFNISNHTPKGISAPMVMQIASTQANMAIRYLVGLEIERDKLHYIYYNSNGELIMQKFSMPIEDK
ncbi:Sulfur carrier protein adenylyltransferase ThiF [hydrothermal vent metagenome]|uniref:Sulfur carrier protein adenylyltransferase ThiF n=1 Tax=hydrothermal vent metagenome TaxID=652676 RepID=A0A1W1EK61_9ZZZZ